MHEIQLMKAHRMYICMGNNQVSLKMTACYGIYRQQVNVILLQRNFKPFFTYIPDTGLWRRKSLFFKKFLYPSIYHCSAHDHVKPKGFTDCPLAV